MIRVFNLGNTHTQTQGVGTQSLYRRWKALGQLVEEEDTLVLHVSQRCEMIQHRAMGMLAYT